LAKSETRFVVNAARSVGLKTDFDLPAPAKIWAAANFGTYTGYKTNETYESYLNIFSDNFFKTWDINVRSGYLAGLTARQINQAVLGSIKDADPGQMQALRKSLEMNTRTMVTHLAETARMETYAKNNSLFSGYRYVATLDSRTCLVCGSLDGKVFEGSEPPKEPPLPQHPNCRCLWLPEIKGMEGFDDDDTRASMDGQVPANMNYEEWLKTQPDEVVRDILGTSRFNLYKSSMPITSFIGSGETLSLQQLIKKEGLELFGGGLIDKTWQAQKAYADTYYTAIRNRDDPTDIENISRNTSFSREEVESIRNHLFIKDDHVLYEDQRGRLATDWKIAQAWQRMEQGWNGNGMDRYRDVDKLLLRHELEELTLIAKHGYTVAQAHEIVEKEYPWDIKIKEILDALAL